MPVCVTPSGYTAHKAMAGAALLRLGRHWRIFNNIDSICGFTILYRCRKPEEEAPGSGTLQTPDLEGDLWSLWDTLDGMGWPTEASAEAEAAMQLLPWTHPLEISTITSAMEQSNGFVTFSQPDGSPNPACQPVVVYNDIAVTDQPPAAAALAVPHVEVCRPATPPAQPRPMQAPSLPGQASPSAAAMTNPVTTPAVTSGPPAWAEPGFLGGAQRAAANWVAAKVEPVPAQPPVQHAPALPRLQPAEMDPPKRRMDSTQRKKVPCAQPHLGQLLSVHTCVER